MHILKSLRKSITRLLRKSTFVSKLVLAYLNFAYRKTEWEIENLDINTSNTIYLLWHENIFIVLYVLSSIKKLNALASPHDDGLSLKNILSNFSIEIIEGSSNKNAASAVKNIFKALSAQENIIITPDGPRGPRREINSNVLRISQKYNSKIVCVFAKQEKYFRINSWDRMIIPKPFGKCTISFKEYEGGNLEEFMSFSLPNNK